MTATPAAIAALAKYTNTVPADDYVTQCANEAADMVGLPVSKAQEKGVNVPATAIARAELEAGKELFDRRQSRNGIVGMGESDFAPMRIARDPMKAAYPFLLPYLGPVMA